MVSAVGKSRKASMVAAKQGGDAVCILDGLSSCQSHEMIRDNNWSINTTEVVEACYHNDILIRS